MFGSHKVKIEGELLEKVKQCSDAAGYESIDEFVIHMLEKETKKILPGGEQHLERRDPETAARAGLHRVTWRFSQNRCWAQGRRGNRGGCSSLS